MSGRSCRYGTDEPTAARETIDAYNLYVHGKIDRRTFFDRVKQVAISGVAAAAIVDQLMPTDAAAQDKRRFMLIGLQEPTNEDAQAGFDEWFVDQHIEDTAKGPNMVRGRVFKLGGPHLSIETKSKYLSTYEADAGAGRRPNGYSTRGKRTQTHGGAPTPPRNKPAIGRHPNENRRLGLV